LKSIIVTDHMCYIIKNIHYPLLLRSNTTTCNLCPPVLHVVSSKTVTSCLSGLYSSLAQLVHWADQLMLQGIVQEEKDAIATVAVVTRAVLDGVKVKCGVWLSSLTSLWQERAIMSSAWWIWWLRWFRSLWREYTFSSVNCMRGKLNNLKWFPNPNRSTHCKKGP